MIHYFVNLRYLLYIYFGVVLWITYSKKRGFIHFVLLSYNHFSVWSLHELTTVISSLLIPTSPYFVFFFLFLWKCFYYYYMVFHISCIEQRADEKNVRNLKKFFDPIPMYKRTSLKGSSLFSVLIMYKLSNLRPTMYL